MKKSALLLSALLCSLAVATAAITNFEINLTGSQETPPNSSLATGSGTASFDSTANTITLDVSFTGLSAPATASHIHVAPPGVAGPVILSFVPYTPAAFSGQIAPDALPFPADNIADLLAGNTYFNIHDSVFPGGEIRGQLVPVPEPAVYACLFGLGLLGFAACRRFRPALSRMAS
jgi:hypothetical protein